MNSTLIIMSFQYLNVPYMWGGQNYLGMDCSGFVLKTLHDSGLTLPDMTANGLYKYCLRNGKKSSSEREAILFFGTIDKIVHTAISLGIIDGQWLMIEAGGAGSNSLTLSREELAQRDARVRIKPVSSRKDLIASIKIPYTEVRNENY